MDCEDGSLDSLDDEAFIAIANELLDKCNLPGKVSKLEECSDNFFVGVYKGLLGDDLPGIIDNPISVEQHIINCQTVIDLVATDVLNVDLSHISGKGIVEGDKVPIRNLLEIFAGLLEYFMECVDDEGSDDEHDSNLLTSEHDIISGVLKEEFGPSYQPLYGPRTELKRPSQLREEVQQPSASQGSEDPSRSLRRPAAAGNSTGFDADTSKLSDSRVDVVSDSTAELIRLGETTSDRNTSKAAKRREAKDYLPDSTTATSSATAVSSESSSVISSDVGGGGVNSRRSVESSVRKMSPDAPHSQGTGSGSRFGSLARKPESSLLSRDATSVEDELTQYTLTPTELGDPLGTKDQV